MNILPHKSWHVRTKKNIARVRKDEKEAAEKELERLKRVGRAENEAKLSILRAKVIGLIKEPNEPQNAIKESIQIQDVHVNLFSNLEEGEIVSEKKNSEHELEKKTEQEKYEKQIGYLTYLGQDTNEALKKQDWYATMPSRTKDHNIEEIDYRTKLSNDPLQVMEKFVGKSTMFSPTLNIEKPKMPSKYESVLKGLLKKDKKRSREEKSHKSKKHKRRKKHKKESKQSSNDDDDVEQQMKLKQLKILREERIKREQKEKLRAENLLREVRDGPQIVAKPIATSKVKQKYNSQFNPDIARQNYESNL